jgi:hypothetical protein
LAALVSLLRFWRIKFYKVRILAFDFRVERGDQCALFWRVWYVRPIVLHSHSSIDVILARSPRMFLKGICLNVLPVTHRRNGPS